MYLPFTFSISSYTFGIMIIAIAITISSPLVFVDSMFINPVLVNSYVGSKNQ
jgi:hypothetical protein